MIRRAENLVKGRVKCNVSKFEMECAEMHVILSVEKNNPFKKQFNDLKLALKELDLEDTCLVFKRLYASDIHTASSVANELNHCVKNDQSGLSLIQQTPLSSARLVLYLYSTDGEFKDVSTLNGVTVHSRPSYKYLWFSNLEANERENAYDQTSFIFSKLNNNFRKENLVIAKNLIRTWLFVSDVDKNYVGVVEARKEFFDGCGLLKDTHYIASTGIEGQSPNIKAYVSMDAMAVGGIEEEQIEYITAPNYLNPTHEYGVTFERATVVNFGDRRHFYLSGTASINSRGEVVKVGDVLGQAERVVENINALLHNARFELDDMMYLIVYLRDQYDYEIVKKYLLHVVGQIPTLFVLAPVCRPDWLIEIEGIAVQKHKSAYPDF